MLGYSFKLGFDASSVMKGSHPAEDVLPQGECVMGIYHLTNVYISPNHALELLLRIKRR
jgi:hypothetical protein